MAATPRVAIISFHHESNTFIPTPTGLEYFDRSIHLYGEVVLERYRHSHHEVGGFFEVLEQERVEAVPIAMVQASPWGKVTDHALQTIWGRIVEELDKAGPVDGLLVGPHGAGVSELYDDMDGWWLTRLREKVGPDLPIITVIDPHANLTPAMVAASQAVIAYRENPHLDQRQRGMEAAALMVRTLRGEIRPVTEAVYPPISINIERQLTRGEPWASINRELEITRALPGVLSASLVFGFPYADVPEMGTAFIVVADDDVTLARREAERLGDWLITHRERFRGEMISPEEALERVFTSPKPVGLLDMGDNAGGGAPGDSMLLAKMTEATGRLRTLLCICDVESVAAAHAAGVGARLTLKIGGKLPMSPVPPLEAEVTVVSFYDGVYTETQPRHGGKTGGNLGPSVVVRTDNGLTALLVSQRGGSGGTAQPLITAGIDLKEFDVLILKGVHAPVGGYAEHCPTLIRVNTPGVTTADLDALTFENRRKPLFPFEEI